MTGADSVSRAPRVLFHLNSLEDIEGFATGCDADMGGTSTTHLDLETLPAVNGGVGRTATAKFWGEMRLNVKSGMEQKIRGGYAGFRNKIPFENFVRTNSGELSSNQIQMAREGIRTIGISLLGGNSGISGKYELGIDSIRIVNEEDVIRTRPGEQLPPIDQHNPNEA
ncbi:hypothetical protein H0H93_009861 [Arthromyces matolae]|nr:hypothetical protein H0H93_009861 [Arthromyces matolae]